MAARIPVIFFSRSVRMGLSLLVALVAILPRPAQALPSFTQQTGVPCAQCHAVGFGPQLTTYGRLFKLNGYVWSDSKTHVPLSLMTIVGDTHTSAGLSEAPEHYGTNNNFAMNELTGFLAGRLAPHLGSIVEVSYSGTERQVAWGAFDVRSAWSGTMDAHSYVAGVTLNNNPSVTDLWNSTPVWSFPYTGSELAPGPAAAPKLYDGISEAVLGPSFYTMIDNHYYLELGAYKSLGNSLLRKVGLSADDNLHMSGLAPYLRAVVQFQKGPHDFSFGLTGLDARLRPDTSISAKDSYADIGFDSTYQYTMGDQVVMANLALVHEKQKLHSSYDTGDAGFVSHKLNFDALRCHVCLAGDLGRDHRPVLHVRDARCLTVHTCRHRRQRQRISRQQWLHPATRIHPVRQGRIVWQPLGERAPGRAVHRLSQVQRGHEQLRWLRTQCQRQQHTVCVRMAGDLTADR